MNVQPVFALVVLLGVSVASPAAIIPFDISPPGFGDEGIGLTGSNEEPTAVASPATGNEIGAGIFFNDTTNQLTLNFAYGTAFGFVDLQGTFSDAHIHLGDKDTAGGVQVSLVPLHTPSGTRSGSFSGNVTLTGTQPASLLANNLYLNIHSSTAGAGEIRGQLVQVPEPAAGMLAGAALALCLSKLRVREQRSSVARA